MKTLYLIDALAQVFRAYHAIRTPMTSPVTREPTNATYGFVGMLLKVLRDLKPDYLAVATDVSGDRETFRSLVFPDYKANRPPPPDDLGPQIDRCVRLLEAIGIPLIGVAGFEADDVIATLADRIGAHTENVKVRIVSKDKDLQQLITPVDPLLGGVEMYDVHTDQLIDAAKLVEDKGITPAQVIDYLALMGDTVDNVPGVPGIGPKTAAQLIGEHGSLDAVIAAARDGKIKGKRGEAIVAAANAGALDLSKQLVSLRHDVPLEFELESAAVERFRMADLAPILRELGFNRYQDDLKALLDGGGGRGGVGGAGGTSPSGAGPAEPVARSVARPVPAGETGGLFDSLAGDVAARAGPRPIDGDYACITTRAAMAKLVEEMQAADIIAIDTETTGLSPLESRICGVSVSTAAGSGAYIPVCAPEGEDCLPEADVAAALRPVLESDSRPKTGHNLKFDMLVLRHAGIELRGLRSDSMVASYLIDSGRSSHSLDALCLALLGRTNISIKELIGTGAKQKTFDHVPLCDAAPYAAEDADVSLRLMQIMSPQLEAMGLAGLFRDVEMPLVSVLAELEWNGIRVDPAELDLQRERLAARAQELRTEIIEAAEHATGRGFNPDSPKQLASLLFNSPAHSEEPGLGIRPLRRGKTGPSTDVEVLEKLAADPAVASPIPQLVVEYRQLTKLVNTYLLALKDAINPATGRIHASFNQTVAATGRLSSSDPNLQNIPIRTELGREIRRAFIAEEGCVLIGADYSQIELRLLAHLSRDPALIEAFERGEDIHAAVAAQIHHVDISQVTREQRSSAKMVNFGIVYGVTPYGLARRLGIDNTAAAGIIDGYKRRFAGITTFLQECIEQARRTGYVETMLKRRRPITDIDSNNASRRALAERTAINSVVQGSAADLIKLAMIDLHTRLSEHAGHLRGPAAGSAYPPPEIDGVKMLLQIHDELVFEAEADSAEEARRLIVSRMEAAMTLSVPLVVDSSISTNWFDGK